MSKPKIIAVDFDGTLCTNNYPEIGEPIEEVINYVKEQQEAGAKIILWTCRVQQRLADAVEWCSEQGLTFDAVNQNLPEIVEEFGGDSRKVYADEYIDDRNKSVGNYKRGLRSNVMIIDDTCDYSCNGKDE